jgi:zinc/manganese transport system permease protein
MEHLSGVWRLLLWPLAACVTMGLLHAYSGLHVLRRGVIFVDIALAQMAALGAVAGMFLSPPEGHTVRPSASTVALSPARASDNNAGDELDQAIRQTGQTETDTSLPDPEVEHHEEGFLAFWPTAFALFGAVLLAYGRLPGQRIPHEAIIGVVYVVAAATTVLLLSRSPHAHEQMEEMLTGKLLFVDRAEVLHTAAVYAVLGLLHCILFRRFLAISTSPEQAEARGMHVRLWDCVFYGMFAILVTRSVAVAGVLVVFTLLIIPGACAAAFTENFKAQMVLAWVISTVVIVVGLAVSVLADLPSGSTLVATFGAALALCLLLGGVARRTLTRGRVAPSVPADKP